MKISVKRVEEMREREREREREERKQGLGLNVSTPNLSTYLSYRNMAK